MEIRLIEKADYDSCLKISKELSDWFDENELNEISKNIKILPTYVFYEDKVKGFIVLEEKSDDEVEIIHIAVSKNERNQGIGGELLNFIEELYSNKKNITVKTLDESAEYEPYESTRAFYIKNGFKKIKVIENYPGWEPGNPCAIYIKSLS